MLSAFCSCCLADCGDYSGTGFCNWNYLWSADSSILDLSPQRTCRKQVNCMNAKKYSVVLNFFQKNGGQFWPLFSSCSCLVLVWACSSTCVAANKVNKTYYA